MFAKILQRRFFWILSISLFLSATLFSNLQYAKWSPIDDHEIMVFLKGAQRITLHDAWQLWTRDLSGTRRFHPAYSFLRVLETLLWGDNLTLWYSFRILIFGCTFALTWYFCTPVLGFVLSFLLTLTFFTQGFWADIVGRLGPAEIYAVLGATITGVGFFPLYVSLLHERTIEKNWWRYVALGTCITVFSKENMIVFVVPIVFLFIVTIGKRRLTQTALIAFFLIGLTTIGTVVGITDIAKTYGSDVYGNSLGAQSRVELVKTTVMLKTSLVLIAFVVTSFIFFLFSDHSRKKLWISVFFVLLFAESLFISQFVFYVGKWPTQTRYDFPGILFSFFMLIVACRVFLLGRKIFSQRKTYLQLSYALICFFAFFYFVKTQQIRSLQTDVSTYTSMTRRYSEGVERILLASTYPPDKNVIIESTSTNDLETIHAIGVYIRQSNLHPKLFLRVHQTPADVFFDPFHTSLLLSLQKSSTEGTDIFMPLEKLNEKLPCISFFLNEKKDTECVEYYIVDTQFR